MPQPNSTPGSLSAFCTGRYAAYAAALDILAAEGRLRAIPPHTPASDGLLDLCSNDYMGLAAMATQFSGEFTDRWPGVAMTASASRLLASGQALFDGLEGWLGEHYGKPALLFNSGYHANTGLIQALSLPGTVWLVDRLAHASMIDGLRMAGAVVSRWRHNDVGALRRCMARHGDAPRVVVAVESVYSMDGDAAPLEDLAALRREWPSMLLYVDEAHALGVFGREGLGLCSALGLLNDVDVLVGTLGKACASSGAFAILPAVLRDYMVNTARSLIFSTAIPPACAAWSRLMLEQLAGMDSRRRHLMEISARFKAGIERMTGLPNPSSSPIVPMMCGSAEKAVAMSEALKRRGILALPIRRPTVPPGGERIRFSLNAALTEADVDRAIGQIEEAASETGLTPPSGLNMQTET